MAVRRALNRGIETDESRAASIDRFEARFARHMACALFHVACIAEELPRTVRADFWRKALPLAQAGDETPLEWRRAAERLRERHGELLAGIGQATGVEHTRELYAAADVVAQTGLALGDGCYWYFGMVLLEIAESRCVGYGQHDRLLFSDHRRALREEPEYSRVRGSHRIFADMTGVKSAGETHNRRKGVNLWKVRPRGNRGRKLAAPAGNQEWSRLSQPTGVQG